MGFTHRALDQDTDRTLCNVIPGHQRSQLTLLWDFVRQRDGCQNAEAELFVFFQDVIRCNDPEPVPRWTERTGKEEPTAFTLFDRVMDNRRLESDPVIFREETDERNPVGKAAPHGIVDNHEAIVLGVPGFGKDMVTLTCSSATWQRRLETVQAIRFKNTADDEDLLNPAQKNTMVAMPAHKTIADRCRDTRRNPNPVSTTIRDSDTPEAGSCIQDDNG
jgi:hypothetical protein